MLLALLIAFVAAVVLTTHWPTLSARALSFDDNQYLTENHLVQHPSWDSAGRFLREIRAPSTVRGYYQPLTMISLMLDYAAGGRVDNLRPFHRTSLALHVANTALVIVLIYMLFGEPWIAAILGLLFGIHPLTVEPIPWIGERKTLLAAFFSFWCLILYVRYTRRKRWTLLAGCLAAYVLALMSKPTSTPLPVVMLLLDFWPLRRLSTRGVVEKVPFFIVGGISAIVTCISQSNTAAVILPSQRSPMHIPLILCHNIIFYLYKIVWPVKLSSHYPLPDPLTLSHAMALVGVVGTCVLLPVLLISLRRTRAPLTGWLIFFVAILPTMQIIGFSNVIASDKYVYLPSVGLLLVAAWGLGRLWTAAARKGRLAAVRAATLLSVILVSGIEIAATRHHVRHWDDTEGLYRYMLTLTPNASALHANLGSALWGLGRMAEATEEYSVAVRLTPGFADAQSSLGTLLAQQGRLDDALRHCREGLRLRPNSPQTYNSLAFVLASAGQLDAAIACYNSALQLKLEYPDAHNGLGNALLRKGKTGEAIQHYREAIRLKPGFAGARLNLSCALASQGRLDDAVRYAEEALRLKPDLPEAHNNLGKFLAAQGKLDEAVAHEREAIHLDPRFPEAHTNLGNALAAQGKLDEAVQHLAKALEFAPGSLSTRISLANALAKQGRIDDAIGQYRQVLQIDPSHAVASRQLTAITADQGPVRPR